MGAGLQQPAYTVGELDGMDESLWMFFRLGSRVEHLRDFRIRERGLAACCPGRIGFVDERPAVIDAAHGGYAHGLGVGWVGGDRVVVGREVVVERLAWLAVGVAFGAVVFAEPRDLCGQPERCVADVGDVPVGVGDLQGFEDAVIVDGAGGQLGRVCDLGW